MGFLPFSRSPYGATLGLVDTEEERRRQAAGFGIDGPTFDRLQSVQVQDTPSITSGLLGSQARMVPPQLPDSSNQPRPMDPEVAGMLGNAPEAPRSFWQGGKKFTGRDAAAGILAAVGDAFARQNGQEGTAINGLLGVRNDGLKAAREAIAAYARNQQVARLPNMNAREFAAYQADPKAWGGHMADAYSTHHAAANLNEGDQRVFGNPNNGGSVYQAPTGAQLYANDLGRTPGTKDFSTAVQDYVLRANGPTAYGYDVALANQRNQNAMGLEGLRQQNRMQIRGAPTYRDLNPPPPRASGRQGGMGPSPNRGGGGGNGVVTVRSVAEANNLPPGTRYRAPDGRVRVR